MLLQACLNGSRRPGEHPALPVTPAAVARDAALVVASGAGAVHVHPKDDAGADSLRPGDVAAVVDAVRAAAPGIPVGVTTGAWAAPDPADWIAAIRGWAVVPDFASLNWHEDGADGVAAALLDRGIGVEAGLWHLAGAAAWAASPHRDRCLRVLLELPDGLDEAGTGTAAGRLLTAVGDRAPVLLHGEGSSAWPALRLAARRGLDTRIGLEDVLELPDGSPAPGNAELIRAATTVTAAVGASGEAGG
ncbi:3-keto-5-aminohexanoate cleavage protein [Blastococcus sp. SYSU DS1021]